ncbi:uncharacterized protein LOC122519917 [Polistes fuscatus]|uniref:uncharacterized protein LOC122519917 n=1 Tax=Polistes fuscatus TaxID=30207 RepID=UPI001CA9D6C9|nr:uncharacterized protein LOC122519917 [Polistes fuscatus]
MKTILGILVIYHITVISALLGYDCGGTAANITTVSLLETGECDLPNTTVNKTKTFVQLLQLVDYDSTMVFQCRVEIDRTIYYCGMSSHISAVHNGRRVYLLEISREVCNSIIKTGTLSLNSFTQISGLKVNTTDFRSITLAGSIGIDGRCQGTQYSDADGTWESVVVQGVVRTNIKTYTGIVKIKDNSIALRGHIQCSFSEETCFTDENGNAFWTVIPRSSCHFEMYSALYEGEAVKMTTLDNNSHIYAVTEGETTFALMGKQEENVCGYKLIRTEHPKLFILETGRDRTFTSRTKLSTNNMDLFTYVNSKFVYVEKHHQNQMENLYNNVLQQRCKLEKKSSKTHSHLRYYSLTFLR